MKRFSIFDIRGPIAPKAGRILGAAGHLDRHNHCTSQPDLCQIPTNLQPWAGSGRCGSLPRFL